MEITLIQDSINIIEEDSGGQAEVWQVRSARQVRLARLGLTTCDLQLRKVINSLSELCFGCSLTLWKDHGFKIPSMCL